MFRNSIATAIGRYESSLSVEQSCDALQDDLGGDPDLIIVSHTAISNSHSYAEIIRNKFPTAKCMGSTSCRGVLTNEGLSDFGQPGYALWALRDLDGDFGVGVASFGDSISNATLDALNQAISSADREGELPDLVWIHSSPGNEEAVVRSIDQYYESDVLIVGGSSADEALEAKWSCFADSSSTNTGVAIAVFYTSFKVSTSFQSGYKPTSVTGVATRCEGRVVYEIDNKPAAQVYNSWTNNLVDLEEQPLPINVLGTSTLSPIGVAMGDVSGIPYYNLAHPETYTEDEALSFFCQIDEGEKLTLMEGTPDNILSRPGRVANEASHTLTGEANGVAGGLIIFCGGCLLAVESRASEIQQHLASAFVDAPYMGAFTFGEQGRFHNGENRHGNLMISVTLFHR